MKLDLEAFKRAAQAATPGPWRWWTNNSYRRLSSDATGKDGDVAYAYAYANSIDYDGHADIEIKNENMKFIALANPAAVLALIERLELAEEVVARLAEREMETSSEG